MQLKNFRPHQCTFEGCTKSFMSLGHLRNHMDTHQEVKAYICPVAGCNQSYSRKQRLKVHIKKHSGTRDFKCPFENCNKAFYEKGNLKTHLRLHTGEKPYHCTAKGCSKSFATQGHLNDHVSKFHDANSKNRSAREQRYQRFDLGLSKLGQSMVSANRRSSPDSNTLRASQRPPPSSDALQPIEEVPDQASMRDDGVPNFAQLQAPTSMAKNEDEATSSVES